MVLHRTAIVNECGLRSAQPQGWRCGCGDDLTKAPFAVERVDAGCVTVRPRQTQCVVANLAEIREFQTAASHESNRTLMTLAHRARAIAAQDVVRVDAAMPVREVDLHRVRLGQGEAQPLGIGRDLVIVHREAGIEDDVVEAVRTAAKNDQKCTWLW